MVSASQQNHVRGLAQAGTQSGEVVRGINGNFPLADNTLLVPMEEFDRVLQRDDVALPGAVDSVNDAGLGGGLAASGGAGDQHHAVGDIGQLHNLLGDSQGLPVGDVKGHHPDHSGQRAPLKVGVDPEPCQTRYGKGEIVVSPLQIGFHGALGHTVKVGDEAAGFGGKKLFFGNGTDVAVQLFTYHAAGHQKQIGSSVLYGTGQIVNQFRHMAISPYL